MVGTVDVVVVATGATVVATGATVVTATKVFAVSTEGMVGDGTETTAGKEVVLLGLFFATVVVVEPITEIVVDGVEELVDDV